MVIHTNRHVTSRSLSIKTYIIAIALLTCANTILCSFTGFDSLLDKAQEQVQVSAKKSRGKEYLKIYQLDFKLTDTVLTKEDLQDLAKELERNPTLHEANGYARQIGKKPFCDQTPLELFISSATAKLSPTIGPVLPFVGIVLISRIMNSISWRNHSYDLEQESGATPFKMYKPGEIKDNFASVAGNHEGKEAFSDIVEYLKNPAKYFKIGAKPPKGILLTGAPGTGKTLLARALAGEANCTFIYANGSDFNNVWRSSGTLNIKRLFALARLQSELSSSKAGKTTENTEKKPCIIFIDEVEVLAKRRGSDVVGGSDSDQTVNQLLTELDGFVQDEYPIILIAATNFPEKIDPAFLRAGRIDRTIHVNAPCAQDRHDILHIHLQKMVYDQNIDLTTIADRTSGFSGAQLAEIIHTAARLAANRNANQVEQRDLENALDNLTIGVVSNVCMTEHERKVTAYHEAGHALIGLLLDKKRLVNKVTILPRGDALGVTHFITKGEQSCITTQQELENHLCMIFGGRAAEAVIFNIVTTGPSSDLQAARQLAQGMIEYFGMGQNLALHTEAEIEKEVGTILKRELERAQQILTSNIDKLHTLAQALLKKETLLYDDIMALNLV